MPYDLDEIKIIRKKIGLTQSELAKRANVSQSLIAKIESGRIDPTYSKAKGIFDTLTQLTKKTEIKADDVMNKRVIAAKSNDLVRDVIKKMKKYDISQVPVIDKHVIGLVSETAILNNMKKINSEVKEIMESAPPIISRETGVDIVTSLLKFFPIVLVLDNGRIEGLITKADILSKLGRV